MAKTTTHADYTATALTLTTAAQPNITSVGTLTSFRSTGIDDNADATAITIDSSENVGIGDTSPAAKLEIKQGSGNWYEGIRINRSSNTTQFGTFSNNSGATFIGAVDSAGGSNNAILFGNSTDGTTFSEKMRIDSSGNVGIGTNSPVRTLQVYTAGSNSSYISINNGNTGATVSDGVVIGAASDSVAYFWNYENAAMGFATNNTERMRIDSSGYLLLGTTTTASSNDTKLVVSSGTGAFTQYSYNGGAGSVIGAPAVSEMAMYTYTGNIGSETYTERMRIDSSGKIGMGGITSPAQNFVVGTTTNYDPPGLGSSNANFAILKQDGAAAGKYGLITGISSDGNVWSQVQRTDGTATAYNYYLQPDGGSVGIGIPQNHTYIPNLTVPFRVGKVRSGTGNDTDYLTKMSIDAIGYAGSDYQFGAIDFTGGDTAGASGNHYGRIGCSSMVGTNNQETGSLEFYVKAPSFGMSGTTHAMKITGKVDTGSAGGGTSRNGVLFTYQGIAIDRTWSDYPCISVLNATPYSSTASTQSELRIHGNNISSASYPGTSGSDFSVVVRSDGGYATGSDRRRKRNITTIDNALSKVKQLTGKRFQTVNRVDEVQEHVSKNGYKLGFIAQDVEDIIPEAVQYHADEDDGTEDWNSAYSMDYGSVVALLVNAIKEQDVIIEDLKTRIETLEG